MPYSYTDPYAGAGPTPVFGTNTFFIDPTASSNGTGTPTNPFNSWAGVPTSTVGYRYYQKRGTSWSGTFPAILSGTSAGRTTIGAYANTDGSDDATLAKPIINIGDAMFPGTLNSPRTFIRWLNVELRNTRQTATSDTPMFYLGSNIEINGCTLSTNLTCLYGEKCSNIRIEGNTITCATLTGNVSQNAIVITGAADMDSNTVISNTIKVGEGGQSASHVVRMEAYSGFRQTNVIVKGNILRTVSNVMTTLPARRGISCSNLTGGEISYNNVSLFVSGVFANSSTGVWIHHNTCNYNGNFGIHVTGSTSGFLIEWNTCNYSGGNYPAMNYYGRGIELAGASVLNSCTQHIIRYNTCSYTYNYGGTNDNGTEGCGIGLDDATSFCTVYGNTMVNNEGNGLQIYGGSPVPGDTGGHTVCGNFFINNGIYSYRNRWKGGTQYLTDGACHILLSNTRGSRTVVTNNLMTKGIGGVHIGTNCDVNSIEVSNNVYQELSSYACSVPSVTYTRASVGTYFDNSGVLQTAATNVTRTNYNPVNLSASPTLLIEGASTNVVRNNTMIGAVIGTVNIPTGWGPATNVPGLSRQVVGLGQEDGIDYIDIRVYGAVGSVAIPEYTFQFTNNLNTPTSQGDTWVSSLFVKIVSGLDANLSALEHYVIVYKNDGSLAEAKQALYTPSTTRLRENRYSYTMTVSSVEAAFVANRIDLNFKNGGGYNVDVVMRVGLPQLERSIVSSPIRTYGSSVSRAADISNIRNNIYKPGIPKQIVDTAVGANSVPAHNLISTGSQGDLNVDPKINAKYVAQEGSPLLITANRENVAWPALVRSGT